VLPTLWFRNTWRYTSGEAPGLRLDGDGIVVDHPRLSGYRLDAAPTVEGVRPEALFCDNETNNPRLFGAAPITDMDCAPSQSVTPRHIKCLACPVQLSSTSLPNLTRQCMVAIPTGADRCGFQSITWSFARCCSTANSLGRNSRSSTQPDPASILALRDIAGDLADRLVGIWLPGPDGRRPVYGGVELMQTDPAWKDNLLFYEYFHGDNGAGLGAMHQTGWTALVADLLLDPRAGYAGWSSTTTPAQPRT
jgi:hypothetical protein